MPIISRTSGLTVLNSAANEIYLGTKNELMHACDQDELR